MWQPIETAPEGEVVLGYEPSNDWLWVVMRREGSTFFQQGDEAGLCVFPTRWMPLPDLPD